MAKTSYGKHERGKGKQKLNWDGNWERIAKKQIRENINLLCYCIRQQSRAREVRNYHPIENKPEPISKRSLVHDCLCGEFLMVTWRLKVWFDCAESRPRKKEAQSYKQTWDWTMLLATFKHFSWGIVSGTDAFFQRHFMRIATTTRSHSSSHVWTMLLTVSWVHGPVCPVKRHWNFTRQNKFDLFSTSKRRTTFSLACFFVVYGLN